MIFIHKCFNFIPYYGIIKLLAILNLLNNAKGDFYIRIKKALYIFEIDRRPKGFYRKVISMENPYKKCWVEEFWC